MLERSDSSPRVLWEQPAEGFAFAAMGTVARLEAAGARRFEAVERQWGLLVPSLVTFGNPDIAQMPVAVAGFSFDTHREGQRGSLPEALLIVPRLTVVRTGALYWLRVTVVVAADSDPEALAAESAAEVRQLLDPGPKAADLPCAPISFSREEDDARWASSVEEALRQIRSGAVEKVVLARSRSTASNGASFPAAALRRLRERYPGCTTVAFDDGERCFFAATPERLVGLDGRRLSIDCLAGSIRRGAMPEEDERLGQELLTNSKELREHGVVVSELLSQVREVAEEVAVPDGPTLRRFSNIQHLYTPISGQTRPDQSILQLVERLHPTPATCGRPREAARDLIRELEGFDRGWYAGPIGWLDSDGGGDFVVGLRSALISHEDGQAGRPRA